MTGETRVWSLWFSSGGEFNWIDIFKRQGNALGASEFDKTPGRSDKRITTAVLIVRERGLGEPDLPGQFRLGQT